MNQHHPQQPPTIAILGTGTLSEEILAQLLRDEGYAARIVEAQPAGPTNGWWLDGADVLLLAPDRKDGGCTASSLGATRSTPDAAPVPLLPLPPTLKLALLDEPAVSVPWREQFEGLVRQIEAALGRATAEAEEAV